ncbi:MAG: Na+/H+ antiporter NhaA [Stellaceae bacterium]
MPLPRAHGTEKSDLYGGVALGIAALAALLVANSPLGPHYEAILETTGEVRIGSIGLAKSLEHWINDGLMAIFFLLVALEIKREALEGALASARRAALPVIAAAGGFLLPAALYAGVNWGNAQALRGWAVASATDIAFAIAICAMLGRAVPASLKTFLLALAIIDDLAAIIVIAIFYTADLSVASLMLAAIGITGLAILNLLDIRTPSAYVVIGLFTWVCVLESGVHATLAGVAVGFAMPLTRHDGESLLEHAEHALKPWVSYGIMPVFAFANAGVSFVGVSPASNTASVPLGIVIGLFFGKQLGVFLPSMAAARLGIAEWPAGASLSQLYGTAILTGIGFTMSLFIGTLAFEDEPTMTAVRLAVIIASALSAIVGAAILIVAGRGSRRAD